MIVIDELKEAVNIMLHPGTATQKERSIRAAIAFYYKVLVVPLILYIILALAIPKTTLSSFMPSPLFTVILLIVSPLGLLAVAGLYHLFGKLLKVFNNPYSNTFTATVYSTVPYVLFIWLLAFTNIANLMLLVGIEIIFFIVLIWEIIITIIALANQQKTSKLRAFAVWLVTLIVLVIVYLVVIVTALFALGSFSSSTSSLLATTCTPQIGFVCTNPIFSGGVLKMTIGRTAGQPWTTATLCFVPGNVTSSNLMSFNLTTCPTGYETGSYNVPSGLAPNQSVPVTFALSGVSAKPGTIVSGTIWAIYTTSGATSPTSVPIAAVIAEAK